MGLGGLIGEPPFLEAADLKPTARLKPRISAVEDRLTQEERRLLCVVRGAHDSVSVCRAGQEQAYLWLWLALRDVRENVKQGGDRRANLCFTHALRRSFLKGATQTGPG